MNRFPSYTVIAAIALGTSTVAIGQSNNSSQGQERSAFVQEFRDPGNSEAKAVAEREGISVGEATKRLRLERQAANLLFRLNRKGVADDVVMRIEEGKLVIRQAAASPSIDSEIEGAIDSDLRGNISRQILKRSPRELKSVVASLAPALQGAPGFQGSRLKNREGELTILTTDADAMKAFVATEALTIPEFVSVEASAPIVLTATVRGGRPAQYDTSSCNGGTWGWVVFETANTSRRGILTAAHVVRENTRSSLVYPNKTTATACGSGTTQSLVREWRGYNDPTDPASATYGVDMAYLRNSGDTYQRLYYDGTGDKYVHGAYLPPKNVRLCRFGQITGQACGVLQDDTIWSNGYGYMSWLYLNSGKTTRKGDSGGPVWYGSTYTYATGLVHAVWGEGSRSMLYSEVVNLSNRGTGLEILYFD